MKKHEMIMFILTILFVMFFVTSSGKVAEGYKVKKKPLKRNMNSPSYMTSPWY